METNTQEYVLEIIAEFFNISEEKIFPETNLGRDIGASSDEIFQLIAETLTDTLDVSMGEYDVSVIITAQDVLDLMKRACDLEKMPIGSPEYIKSGEGFEIVHIGPFTTLKYIAGEAP